MQPNPPESRIDQFCKTLEGLAAKYPEFSTPVGQAIKAAQEYQIHVRNTVLSDSETQPW